MHLLPRPQLSGPSSKNRGDGERCRRERVRELGKASGNNRRAAVSRESPLLNSTLVSPGLGHRAPDETTARLQSCVQRRAGARRPPGPLAICCTATGGRGGRETRAARRAAERGLQQQAGAWAVSPRPAGHRRRRSALPLTPLFPRPRHCAGVADITHQLSLFGEREATDAATLQQFGSSSFREHSTPQREDARMQGRSVALGSLMAGTKHLYVRTSQKGAEAARPDSVP